MSSGIFGQVVTYSDLRFPALQSLLLEQLEQLEFSNDDDDWMCEDAKLLWQEFEQKLVTLHNNKRATGQA
jgi:hypothetical protein